MCGSAAGAAISASLTKSAQPTHLQSLVKAFSWRLVATATTAMIAYAITGEINTALLIGDIEFFLKIGIYYLHERVWLMLT